MTISFPRIRALKIPVLPVALQDEVEHQYRDLAKFHDRAMAIKERLLDESGISPGQYGEAINALANENAAYRRNVTEAQARLAYLIAELEALLEGERKKLRPYPD